MKPGNSKEETSVRVPRRLLVAVVGMSPQVVTETIWVLIKERRFCPDEVRLITTCNGRNRALRDLLDPTTDSSERFVLTKIPSPSFRTTKDGNLTTSALQKRTPPQPTRSFA